jgi:hypothetical protein
VTRAGERIELWQDPGGMWRWAWVSGRPEDGDGLELPASEPVPTREEALAAARLAYPGLPVTDPPAGRHPAPDERSPDLRSRRWPWVLATVGLTGALAGLGVRSRRWGVVAIAPVVAAGVVARLRRTVP